MPSLVPTVSSPAPDPTIDPSAVGHAVERGELRLDYQPIRDARTDRVATVEALVRWAHPDRGLLLPAAFLPAVAGRAEAARVGRWVLERACADLRRLHDRGHLGLRVAVNVDPEQLDDPAFADTVRGLLRAHDLRPSHLVVELTERAPVLTGERTQQLEALATFGVKIALDDVGSGYASLELLDRLPFHVVKIDGGFVRRLGRAGSADAVVRALVEVADGLDAELVAECVETGDQSARLLTLGVHLQQGWLHGYPVDVDDLDLRPRHAALAPLAERSAPPAGDAERSAAAAQVRRRLAAHPARLGAFEELVAVAARITGQPVAAMTLVDEATQWFLAAEGIEGRPLPRAHALCGPTLAGSGVRDVGDTRQDATTARSPLVVHPPYVRSYAGAAVRTADGHAVGTLCVMGYTAQRLSALQAACLDDLARRAGRLLDGTRDDAPLAGALAYATATAG